MLRMFVDREEITLSGVVKFLQMRIGQTQVEADSVIGVLFGDLAEVIHCRLIDSVLSEERAQSEQYSRRHVWVGRWELAVETRELLRLNQTSCKPNEQDGIA